VNVCAGLQQLTVLASACWLTALPLPSIAAGEVDDRRLLAEQESGMNWLRKSGNAYAQYFSPLDVISTDNVDELGVAWSRTLPVTDGIAGTPIVVDGRIFVGAAYSIVMALDAGTGRIQWSYDPGVRQAIAELPMHSWLARASRGIAVGEGRVYVATADCRLLAVDADRGNKLWEVTTCDPALGYGISDSPYYGGGKVFVGNAGSESGMPNRGYVSAYDAGSGKLAWRFYTVPSADPAENTTPEMKMAAATWTRTALEQFGGGGSNWNAMTYDPQARRLYFGTAGALPYVNALRNPDGGDGLFTSSVLAVDADTGEYQWHYQTVPGDSWEYNATMNIVLADLDIDGKSRKALLIAPKNGFAYTLDRDTGELIAADKYARATWASHINPETGRPVLTGEGEYWAAEPGSTTLVWPNMWGAHSWNPMAYSPLNGLLYIPVIDIPSEVTWLGDGDFTDTLKLVTEVDSKPFSPGKLVAWDPVAQKARWSIDHELPFNGGVLATAGKLVFQGDAGGRFSAYHADSGEPLWSMPTGSTIGAAPASYALDGEQYILLPVGLGGGLQYSYPELHAVDQAQGPTRLIAFRLGGDPAPDMPTFSRRTLPDQPSLDAPAGIVDNGRAVYESHCSWCHGRNAVARYGGSVPDLRYATTAIHETWHAIVVGGARRQGGMPAQPLSIEESEAVRAYVLSLSEQLRGQTP